MSIQDFGFTSVPAIMVIVYLLGYVLQSVIPSEKINPHIPAICGVSGLLLAIIAFYFVPGTIETDNVFSAAAIGIVSGLAATGVNQIFKQNTKK